LHNPQLSEFSTILLFIIGGMLFVAAGMLVSKIIRPFRPNPEKLSSYECGEDPIGDAWGQFNIKFYIIALIFLVFEVEMIFLFPWATVFGKKEIIESSNGLWGWFAVAEIFIFIAILVLGLIYAWKKGFLDWIQPKQRIVDFKSPVPARLYEELNQRYTKNESKPS